MRWRRFGIGVLAAVVLGALALLLMNPSQGVHERSRRVKSADNVRTMITLRISAGAEGAGLRGRNWILSLVPPHGFDARNPQNLEALWPPSSPELEKLDLSAYKALTPELLRSQRFPHLTGYSGPGEQEPGWKGARPLIGDLTHPDGAIIGFSDGSVRFLERDELGLGDDDPIQAGPTSKSPLLRMLSDE